MRIVFRAKRKIKWIIAMLVIGMLSGKVEAAELTQTETTVIENRDGYEISGLSIRIGEIKDGLFVRSYNDEMSIIFKELEGDERTQAYDICKQARTLAELTPEMKTAGYVIDDITKYALSPEDYSMMYGGDAGENAVTPEPVDENTRFGFVTFAAATEDVIHETCFVGIKDENGGYQEFDLYEVNGYTTLQQLPIGTYTITEGGINADYTGKYPLKCKENTFEITENCSIIVPLAIGDVDIPGQKIEETPEPTQTPEPTPEPVEEVVEKSNSGVIAWIISAGCLIVLGIIAYVVYKKKTK